MKETKRNGGAETRAVLAVIWSLSYSHLESVTLDRIVYLMMSLRSTTMSLSRHILVRRGQTYFTSLYESTAASRNALTRVYNLAFMNLY